MGTLIIFIAAVCWGVIGLFTRPLLNMGFTPMQLAAVRALTGTLFAVSYCLVRDPRLLKIRLKDLWIFLGTGLLSFAMMNVLYYTTQQLCSLSVAAVLLYTSPIFVMILSAVLFKESITPVKVAALVLAAAGCVLVSGIGAGRFTAAGLLTGIGSGLAYALYGIFSRYGLKRYDPLTVTAYTFLVASVGTVFLASPIRTGKMIAQKPSALLFMLGLGLVASFIPFLCYTEGLKTVAVGKAAVLATLEPVVASFVGIFVFREPISALGIAGIALVLSAVLILNLEGVMRCRRTRKN